MQGKLCIVPHTYWIRAGILRASCRVSYVDLFESAKGGLLERRQHGGKVYYRSTIKPMFEVRADELIGTIALKLNGD